MISRWLRRHIHLNSVTLCKYSEEFLLLTRKTAAHLNFVTLSKYSAFTTEYRVIFKFCHYPIFLLNTCSKHAITRAFWILSLVNHFSITLLSLFYHFSITLWLNARAAIHHVDAVSKAKVLPRWYPILLFCDNSCLSRDMLVTTRSRMALPRPGASWQRHSRPRCHSHITRQSLFVTFPSARANKCGSLNNNLKKSLGLRLVIFLDCYLEDTHLLTRASWSRGGGITYSFWNASVFSFSV